MDAIEPESLLERFAARKAHQIGATKDFLNIRGHKGQIEQDQADGVANRSTLAGFKCLHYSVTESSGHVSLTIIKAQQNGFVRLGIRTIDDSASDGKEFKAIDEVITMKESENEYV